MKTIFSTKNVVETIRSHNGQLDEAFSLYVRVLSRKRGISRQDLAHRLGIEQQEVTYLYCGLRHRSEVPEYLLRVMEREFGLLYSEFVNILRNQTDFIHLPNCNFDNPSVLLDGDEQSLFDVDGYKENVTSAPATENLRFRKFTREID